MKKIFFAFIMCTILISLIITDFCDTEKSLSKNLLRMHIIANSDSDADQSIKLKVRDNILSEMGNELSKYNNASQAKKDVSEKLEKIRIIARNTLKNEGISENVKVSLENTFFPRKTYGNITLPKGNYDALRVEIGKSRGQNWWCVMFPPLCFADCTTGEIKDKEKLSSVLKEDQLELITSKKETVKIKFKLYELWQDGKEIVNSIFD